jgi:hypothetical protein
MLFYNEKPANPVIKGIGAGWVRAPGTPKLLEVKGKKGRCSPVYNE